jgi:nucleotide-binding universal stress UspA family protein
MTTTTQHNKGRIVVGVDGTAPSKDALVWAARQAEMTGASLEAVLAWKAPLMAYGYTAAGLMGIDAESLAKQTLDETLRSVLGEPDGFEIVPIVVRGSAAATLLDMANGADLLVVGSRGHGAVVGMLAGSVSEHCIAHATCPVVVVRHHEHAA